MSKKDIFGDDVEKKHEEQSFAAMFENANTVVPRSLTTGMDVRGEILAISKEETFVSTGTPTDGVVLTKELLDEDKQFKYKVGDFLDLVVTSVRNGEVRLSRRGAKSSSAESLEDAFDMELPIEGRVVEICNGGFRVNILGKTAFCPISQIDLKFVKEGADYVDKKFEFIITQYDSKGRNIVVSRRRLLEAQKSENEGAFMQKHEMGALLNGKVTRIEQFGAFVEIEPGIEGLVHISEVGWSRLAHPNEMLRVGQDVQVKLLKIEEQEGGKLKISLSIKQAGGEGDPWTTVPSKFPVGSVHAGKVEKKENFGLFVSIAPGITGLLPRSKWRDSTEASQYENKKKGDDISVQVDQILFEEKRMSLGLPSEAEDNSWKTHSTAGKGLGTLGEQFQSLLKTPKK